MKVETLWRKAISTPGESASKIFTSSLFNHLDFQYFLNHDYSRRACSKILSLVLKSEPNSSVEKHAVFYFNPTTVIIEDII